MMCGLLSEKDLVQLQKYSYIFFNQQKCVVQKGLEVGTPVLTESQVISSQVGKKMNSNWPRLIYRTHTKN